MSILVNTHNELEEKVLIAFLDQYNKEINEAEAEIESGDYVDQDYVEKLFANRRKNLNGD